MKRQRARQELAAVGPFATFGVRRAEVCAGKGSGGQAAALKFWRSTRWRGPTALRCSASRPAAQLAARPAGAELGQVPRVSSRGALTRAGRQACAPRRQNSLRGLPAHPFAQQRRRVFAGGLPLPRAAALDCKAVAGRRAQRIAAPSSTGGAARARSAPRDLTRRACLSAASEARAASCATGPQCRAAQGSRTAQRADRRNLSGARRPAAALPARNPRKRTHANSRKGPRADTGFMRRGSREARWSN